ncbi:MAG: hypothetical protein H7122_18855 [Chitinophagaceae bacterium]|nr:hypothetical protein [Chitinophagaceae bacterium]
MKPFHAFIIILVFFTASCKKETFTESGNAKLSTSADTLYFDTLFTSVGSITRYFRIFNNNDQKLRLSNIQLGGGINSAFKINVDGIAGPSVSNIELEANDSVYVFVTVKIDPSAANIPFVIQDSIRIEFNGNLKWVQLEAWGQNANFYRGRLVTGNETWTNVKPYVILDGLQIAQGATLTITKGARIFLHADAPFIVDGTLKVMGEKYDSTRVVFRGDRLDEQYRDFPAAWPGIYFRETSKDNELNFALIKNAYQGIVAFEPSVNGNPKVVLNESIIDNCYDAGIIAIRSDIRARNCLISNCGKNLVLLNGGNYDFLHSSIVSISNNFITHKEPVLLLANFIQDGTTVLSNPLFAVFKNCIFWGENGTTEDEVVVNKQGNASLDVNFQNCLWKIKKDPLLIPGVKASNMIINKNPAFDSVNIQKNYYNFRLKDGSPALDTGVTSSNIVDLDGNPRPLGRPDLGPYEKQ